MDESRAGSGRAQREAAAGRAAIAVQPGEFRHSAPGKREKVFELKGAGVSYSGKSAVKGISMDIHRNDVTAIIGPSGCGKSTLLRSVNRLNDLIDTVRIEGQMQLNGDPTYGPGVDVIELQHVPEDRAHGFGLRRVHQRVGSDDRHGAPPPVDGSNRRATQPGGRTRARPRGS